MPAEALLIKYLGHTHQPFQIFLKALKIAYFFRGEKNQKTKQEVNLFPHMPHINHKCLQNLPCSLWDELRHKLHYHSLR